MTISKKYGTALKFIHKSDFFQNCPAPISDRAPDEIPARSFAAVPFHRLPELRFLSF